MTIRTAIVVMVLILAVSALASGYCGCEDLLLRASGASTLSRASFALGTIALIKPIPGARLFSLGAYATGGVSLGISHYWHFRYDRCRSRFGCGRAGKGYGGGGGGGW